MTLMYRCAAPLMAYIWRAPPTRATLGYYESLINYANDLRTTTVYPSSSLSTLRRARTRNLDVSLLFVPPQPCPARSIALRRDASCCPFLSRIFFSHPPTAPTQLARLFIKTSKLTGFNRIRFTLFVTSWYIIYYVDQSLRPLSGP